jgi:hypothetical protein
MSKLLLGAICGIVFGVIDVAMMLPMSFEGKDKNTALIGAFVNCFVTGFVIGAARLALPDWATGLIFGLLVALPAAIITKSYVPILIVSAIGGTIIGFVVGRWGQ